MTADRYVQPGWFTKNVFNRAFGGSPGEASA